VGIVWSNIKDTMVEFMQEIKAKRVEKERSELIRERQQALVKAVKDYALTRPIDEPMPGAADIYEMEQFKAIWNDTPDDVKVTSESFQEVMAEFPAICEQWREDKARELLSLVPGSPEGRKSTLELATTTFQWFVQYFLRRCSRSNNGISYMCADTVSYPRILIHRCMRKLSSCYNDHDDERSQHFLNMGSEPWNFTGKRMTFNVSSPLVAVIRACGLDPDVTTTQEMEEADLWVECLRCSGNGQLVMGWKTAVCVVTPLSALPTRIDNLLNR
jgi:hypothetical protein